MSKRSHNYDNIIQLNETVLGILSEYDERYFQPFANNFIKAWSNDGKDSEGIKLAINFLYKAVNYEKRDFADFLDQHFPEPRSETQKNCHTNLTRISNCCHISDRDQDIAYDVMEMINHCKRVSKTSSYIISDKISEYFKDHINGHLSEASPFIYEAIMANNAQIILEQKQRENSRFEPIVEITETPLEAEDEKFSEEELRNIFSSREDQEEEVASLFSSLSSNPSRSPNIRNSNSQSLQKKQREL